MGPGTLEYLGLGGLCDRGGHLFRTGKKTDPGGTSKPIRAPIGRPSYNGDGPHLVIAESLCLFDVYYNGFLLVRGSLGPRYCSKAWGCAWTDRDNVCTSVKVFCYSVNY